MTSSTLHFSIVRIDSELMISDLENANWNLARRAEVRTNWNGSTAAIGRHFSAAALWSDAALFIRFIADQQEPLVVNEDLILGSRTMNLWERDVCEIFIAPNQKEPKKYFEFEVAPTGEWLDLAIDSTSGERVTDWNYRSGMEAAAKIEENSVIMAMKIPWDAFGKKPNAGDIWLGNIFRCVGKGPNRGYLAWQPTFTEKPDFHVPEKFGEFRFENQLIALS